MSCIDKNSSVKALVYTSHSHKCRSHVYNWKWSILIFISQLLLTPVQFSSVAQSCPTLCNPMNHSTPGLPVHLGIYSNSCPSSRWCHPAISSFVIHFSSCPQSLPASGSFPMSQLFTWAGQSIGVSALASVLPMNTQDWSPLEWTVWISLQSKGLSRVFSNTTVQNCWLLNNKSAFQVTLLYSTLKILV